MRPSSKSCTDLPAEVHSTHPCCDSCHDDADAGFSELPELEVDGVEWVVCCNKANFLEGRPSTR